MGFFRLFSKLTENLCDDMLVTYIILILDDIHIIDIGQYWPTIISLSKVPLTLDFFVCRQNGGGNG